MGGTAVYKPAPAVSCELPSLAPAAAPYTLLVGAFDDGGGRGGRGSRTTHAPSPGGAGREQRRSSAAAHTFTHTPLPPLRCAATFAPGEERGFTLEVYASAPLTLVDEGGPGGAAMLRRIADDVPAD